MQKLPKIGLPIIFTIAVVLILISKSAVTIGPGEGGVLFERFGDGINTDKTYGEGFHIVAPWNSMLIFKVRQQSISDEMNVLSVNGLEVRVNGTIWYEPEYENLGKLIKTKGQDYVLELLNPAVNAAARSVVGRYTPEQLYSSKRDVIEQEILDEVVNLTQGQFLGTNGYYSYCQYDKVLDFKSTTTSLGFSDIRGARSYNGVFWVNTSLMYLGLLFMPLLGLLLH